MELFKANVAAFSYDLNELKKYIVKIKVLSSSAPESELITKGIFKTKKKIENLLTKISDESFGKSIQNKINFVCRIELGKLNESIEILESSIDLLINYTIVLKDDFLKQENESLSFTDSGLPTLSEKYINEFKPKKKEKKINKVDFPNLVKKNNSFVKEKITYKKDYQIFQIGGKWYEVQGKCKTILKLLDYASKLDEKISTVDVLTKCGSSAKNVKLAFTNRTQNKDLYSKVFDYLIEEKDGFVMLKVSLVPEEWTL